MKKLPTNFTHLHEWGPDGLDALVDLALKLKKSKGKAKPLAGHSLAFCFMNPSLRTQVSMEVAASSLGAHPVTLSLGGSTWSMETREGVVMDGDKPEHLKEAVPVLSRFCSALALRSFPSATSWAEDETEPALTAFRKYSTVPVINLESATGHPCQALADLMTIRENVKRKKKKFLLTWAPHIKGLPVAVPNSAAEMAAMSGMDVVIARPNGYDLDPKTMARVKEQCSKHGASLTVTDDPLKAYDGVHVVYPKSWGSLNPYRAAPDSDPTFRSLWMTDAAKMRRTDGAILLHCLPVRRNLEVADDALDGPWSRTIDEAENRLHTAKAVLLTLLARRKR